MALSKQNVAKAKQILAQIGWGEDTAPWSLYDEKDPLKPGCVIMLGPKADGGWENVFMNVRHITKDQLALFNSRKKEVSNSYFIDDETADDTITRIGWF